MRIREGEAHGPDRTLQLGFVDLGEDHPHPETGTKYPVVLASSLAVKKVPFPDTPFRRAHMDLQQFFIDDLPDFTPANEGLLKVGVSTKNPQDLGGGMGEAVLVTDFRGEDNHFAPTFLYRGVFRNILLEDWINIRFELYERDTGADEYYSHLKNIVGDVPELKNLDILLGIPYLNLATKLFDGIITTFGKNKDDHLWGELPILGVQPVPGGAFLRSGIYALMETKNSFSDEISVQDLKYVDNTLKHETGQRLSNYLLFGISLVEHSPS
jgi:hypothetical protein